MLTSMLVGVDVRVNTLIKLGTIDHRSTDNRPFLVDGIEGTTEYIKRQASLIERTDQGSKLLLFVNVNLNILFEK